MGLGTGLFDAAVRAKRISGGGDTTAPGTISDLFIAWEEGQGQAIGIATNSMPGDNGFGGGDVAFYEIRAWDISPITNDIVWNASLIVDGPWTSAAGRTAGTYQEFVAQLGQGSFWVAIRTKDAAGNVSGISNNVTVTF